MTPIRTTFHRIASCMVCAMLTTVGCNTLSAGQPLDWGDQLNGTYQNPVLNADYSDPDVIRVGELYYMVASDFHFMGMQVLESDDLVNWHVVSQVYNRFDYPGWDTNSHYAGGSWAPAIRYHDGLFYVYFCTPDEGLFMSTAADARGPWSPLHCVKAVKGWEDPCPFWDDDSEDASDHVKAQPADGKHAPTEVKAYLARSQYGAGPIIIHRMSADGRQLLDDGVTVYTGPVAEGPKIMKRHGYYYILIPEGGVCCGWQTVLRSRSIYGPYEKRVVLEQGSTDVNGPHQGALVDCPPSTINTTPAAPADTTWWFFHFQETHPAGRIVHMQPARWHDDWPLIGVDIDGNGIGEPVKVWPKPVTPLSTTEHRTITADALSSGDDGANPSEALLWQWNHNPVDSAWSRDDRSGRLTFRILKAENMKQSRNMITRKTIGFESRATVTMDCSQMKDGDHAGLLCMGKAFMGISVCRQKGRLYICMDGNADNPTAYNEQTIIGQCKNNTVHLRVDINSSTNTHQLSYSTDGRHFTPAGAPYPLRMGYWKGSRIGLYSYTTAINAEGGGTVSFSHFDYIVTR